MTASLRMGTGVRRPVGGGRLWRVEAHSRRLLGIGFSVHRGGILWLERQGWEEEEEPCEVEGSSGSGGENWWRESAAGRGAGAIGVRGVASRIEEGLLAGIRGVEGRRREWHWRLGSGRDAKGEATRVREREVIAETPHWVAVVVRCICLCWFRVVGAPDSWSTSLCTRVAPSQCRLWVAQSCTLRDQFMVGRRRSVRPWKLWRQQTAVNLSVDRDSEVPPHPSPVNCGQGL